MRNLWNDDGGNIVTWEVIFWLTIGISVTVGIKALKNAEISELHELANALLQLNQSYSFAGETNCKASAAGSSAQDTADHIYGRTVPASTKNIDDPVCD